MDVTDFEAVADWLRREEAVAPIQLVIVNAGISGAGRDVWAALRGAVNVNIVGAVNTASAAAEMWSAAGSSGGSGQRIIVLVSTLMVHLPRLPRFAGEEGNHQQAWYYFTKRPLSECGAQALQITMIHKH